MTGFVMDVSKEVLAVWIQLYLSAISNTEKQESTPYKLTFTCLHER